MDASPYYTTVCRGNEGECIQDADADGLNDKWPLFYDNYFVPRGYAVVLLHMVGTGFSSGCPTTGGTPDNLSAKAGIDWLNGRVPGYDKDGNLVTADWHNGRTGMIGKSYDGTLANATAATGVEGLSTIVPISAISSWYDYTRSNGIILTRRQLPVEPLEHGHESGPSRVLRPVPGVARGDRRRRDAATTRRSGPSATTTRTSRTSRRACSSSTGSTTTTSCRITSASGGPARRRTGVDRKIWLGLEGHVDPFDFRREVWVSTLHRWFDRYLQNVKNGIEYEPEADIERVGRRLGDVPQLARSGRAEDGALPEGRRRRARRVLVRGAGRARRPTGPSSTRGTSRRTR